MKLATTKNELLAVERELADPVESTIVQQKGVQLNLLQFGDDLFPSIQLVPVAACIPGIVFK